MRKVRILSIALAGAIVCSLLSGCQLFSKTVMTVNGNKISEDVYKGAIAQTYMYFQQNYGFTDDLLTQDFSDGKTGVDILRENADGLIKEFEAVALYAEEHNIKLEKADRETIKANKDKQIESAGGKKKFIDSLAEQHMNEAFFDYYMERQQIYNKLYEKLFTGDGEFAPSEEEIASTLGNDYYRVKHVLIQTSESDSDYADKKKLAEEIAAKAKSGVDFETLIKENGEDPGMSDNALGYVIDKDGYTISKSSQMISEFTNASTALAVGAVSDAIKSSYGFHIIKRYPLDAAAISENKDQIESEMGMTKFAEEITGFEGGLDVEHTKAYDKVDILAILGIEAQNGASETHSADDGHDHEGTDEASGNASEAQSSEGIEVGEAVPSDKNESEK